MTNKINAQIERALSDGNMLNAKRLAVDIALALALELRDQANRIDALELEAAARRSAP
jgi:hypothetical protein